MKGYNKGLDILGGEETTKQKVIDGSTILVGSMVGAGVVGALLYKKSRGLGFALGALLAGPFVAYIGESSYFSDPKTGA